MLSRRPLLVFLCVPVGIIVLALWSACQPSDAPLALEATVRSAPVKIELMQSITMREQQIREVDGALTLRSRVSELSASFGAKGARITTRMPHPIAIGGDHGDLVDPAWQIGLPRLGRDHDSTGPALSWQSPPTVQPCAADLPCSERVAWIGGESQAFWFHGPDGLAFGLTLDARPEGTGDLRVAWPLTGLEVLPTQIPAVAGNLVLGDQPDRPLLHVSGLRAWDRHGRALVAELAGHGNSVVAVINDRGADYPVTIDPTITLDPMWGIASPIMGANLGISVDVGDIDGDGVGDLVVGMPGYDGGQFSEGGVFVFRGDGSAYETTPAWAWENNQPYDLVGYAVTAFDGNGDGFDDIVVSARGAEAGDPNEGIVFVFWGNAALPAAVPDQILEMNQPDAAFGDVLGDLGDINGDGFLDLGVGVPFWDLGGTGLDEGAFFVYHGSAAGFSATPDLTIEGTLPLDKLGASFDGADIDADGFSDVVLGIPFADVLQPDDGEVRLLLGSSTGLTPTAAWNMVGPQPEGEFGGAVSIAGDLDDDGNLDLLIGAPLGDVAGTDSGGLYLFLGDGTTFVTAPSWGFGPAESGAHFGRAVLGVGDLNGDAVADFVVGAPASSVLNPQAGGFWAWPCESGSGPSQMPVVVRQGLSQAFLGWTFAAAGDANADGYNDVVVGARHDPSAALSGGAVYLYYGVDSMTDLDGDGYCDGTNDCPPGIPGGDCNDFDPADFPGAAERCDGIDNDCDGNLPPEEEDADGDGVMTCAGDCDDNDDTRSPLLPEICDGIDHDCDGQIDNNVVPPVYFPDADGDGYGNPAVTPIQTCTGQPAGTVENNDDCNDLDASFHPGAIDLICDGEDQDCNPATADVPDTDGDGFTPCNDCQGLNTTLQCGDCEDLDRAINPYMDETCGDGVDQDCDGEDQECPKKECTSPDNICEEDPGCDCAYGSQAAPSNKALLVLCFLGVVSLRRRRA